MKGYDYSLPRPYFITIATHQRFCLFGEVANGDIKLNQFGSIAFDQWTRLEKRFLLSDYSTFVIMPNHIHGIICIVRGAGEEFTHETFENPPLRPYIISNCVPGSIGTIIRAYKASVTYRINAMRGYSYPKVWQRNYYEHIIRNEKEYEDIWNYFEANPENWMNDQLNPNSSLESRHKIHT